MEFELLQKDGGPDGSINPKVGTENKLTHHLCHYPGILWQTGCSQSSVESPGNRRIKLEPG